MVIWLGAYSMILQDSRHSGVFDPSATDTPAGRHSAVGSELKIVEDQPKSVKGAYLGTGSYSTGSPCFIAHRLVAQEEPHQKHNQPKWTANLGTIPVTAVVGKDGNCNSGRQFHSKQ